MPVKVRCPECEKVLNAPDKARGRALKCPNCEARVPVPAGRRKKSEGQEGRPSRPQRRRPKSNEGFLDDVDLRQAEDRRVRLCPRCALEVDEEDIECPACGVDIETGQLSERQRRKQQRRGPEPTEFYGRVWKDSWEFMKRNKDLAVRTAMVWTTTLTLAFCCLYTWNFCWTRHEASIYAQAGNGVVVTSSGVTVNGTKDNPVEYFENKYRQTTRFPAPRFSSLTSPPAMFWAALFIAFQLGFGGWATFLTTRVVSATMDGQKKLKRVQSDFFGNLTMGIRFYFWPIVIMLPLLAAPALVTYFNPKDPLPNAIAWGVTLILPILFLLPAAVVHMSQKHTYPAYLLFPMIRSFFKTAAPTMIVTVMIVFFVLLIPAGVGGAIGGMWNRVAAEYAKVQGQILDAIGGSSEKAFVPFVMFHLPIFGVLVGTGLAILSAILAFPSLYVMRAIGLYGLYFNEDLDLVSETTASTPAGFGPRYLAFLVDLLVLGVIGLFMAPLYPALQWLTSTAYDLGDNAPMATGVAFGGLLALVGCVYFARSEGGQARATPGKWSLGIIVLDEKGEPIKTGQGFARAGAGLLTMLTGFIGFVMCAFNERGEALHDKLTKTRVDWKGDDERDT